MSEGGARPAGAWWQWATAWSLQGLAVLAGDAMGLQSSLARVAVIGALAALPLAGLWLVLRRAA